MIKELLTWSYAHKLALQDWRSIDRPARCNPIVDWKLIVCLSILRINHQGIADFTSRTRLRSVDRIVPQRPYLAAVIQRDRQAKTPTTNSTHWQRQVKRAV